MVEEMFSKNTVAPWGPHKSERHVNTAVNFSDVLIFLQMHHIAAKIIQKLGS